jgi:hypothetical protein
LLDPFLSSAHHNPEQVIEVVQRNLRVFVGVSAFEVLARGWVLVQGKAGKLLFTGGWQGNCAFFAFLYRACLIQFAIVSAFS